MDWEIIKIERQNKTLFVEIEEHDVEGKPRRLFNFPLNRGYEQLIDGYPRFVYHIQDAIEKARMVVDADEAIAPLKELVGTRPKPKKSLKEVKLEDRQRHVKELESVKLARRKLAKKKSKVVNVRNGEVVK